MKSYRWHKRALSTVVTGAILLSAVAIMGSMIVAWSQSLLSQHESELQVSFARSINKLNEGLVVENVWFDAVPSPKIVNVTLSNIGTIYLNITKIDFIDPDDGSNLVSTGLISDGGIALNQLYSKNVTYDGWTVDTPINVVVITERDNIITKQVVP